MDALFLPQSLRVAVIGLYPWDPAIAPGGIRAAVFNLVAGLRRHPELDIHVIHCHSDIPRDDTRKEDNVVVHYLALPGRRIVPNMMTAVGRVADLLEILRPSVVHAHLHHFAVAALKAGYSPLWTIHGTPTGAASYAYRRSARLAAPLAGFLAGRYERQALSQVKEITTPDSGLQLRYAKRTQARWHVIENPVADDLFELDRQPVDGRLLMPASVIPLKDPLTMIRALALAGSRFPSLHLQIAGRTDFPGYLRRLKRESRRLGVADRIEFLGLQSRARMLQLYRQAKLVVLTSRIETAPLAASEGLAAGIPVVATRAGGTERIVQDGETGRLVAVGDARALAEAVSQVLGDDSLYRAMSEKARKSAEIRFRKDRIADQFLALYVQAGEGSRSSGKR